MKKYLLFLIVAILIAIFGITLIKENKRLKNENKRYFSNMLKMGTDVLITKDELLRSKAELGTIQLTAREFERLNEKQANEIKALKIRLKDVKNVSVTEVQTIIEVPITITDTIKQCFEFKDAYVNVDGCLTDSIKIEGKDTISVINHIEPKRLLWIIRYGVKDVRTTITNKNPYNQITGASSWEMVR